MYSLWRVCGFNGTYTLARCEERRRATTVVVVVVVAKAAVALMGYDYFAHFDKPVYVLILKNKNKNLNVINFKVL